MFYLIASMLIGFTLVFTFKVAHVKGWDADNITLLNYFFAFLSAFAAALISGKLSAFAALADLDFSALFRGAKAVPDTMFLVLTMGVVTGVLFVVNLSFMNSSVKANGAGITTLFNRSGFLITIALSVLIWQERLPLPRWIGAGLTVCALVMASGIGGKNVSVARPGLLFCMILWVGITDTNNKIYAEYALQEYKSNYTLVIFAVCLAIVSVKMYTKCRREGKPLRFHRHEILAGLIMGCPNAFSSVCQIMALQTLPASVVFPSITAGNLLLSTLVSRIVFKENFNKRQLAAIVLTTASLVLVNVF